MRGLRRRRENKTYSIQRLGPDDFLLIWTFEQCYRGSKRRFHNAGRRDTDRAGAERFAKKWGLAIPEERA